MKKLKNGLTYKNEKIYLNKYLLKKMNISKDKMRKLLILHKKRIDIFEEIRFTKDKEKLKRLGKYVDLVDIKLQKTWGFKIDFRLLSWWVRTPKCTCSIKKNSKLQNLYFLDKEEEITSLKEVKNFRDIKINCPIHGM